MIYRPGIPTDAEAIASLIAFFQSELTDDPSGAGAEQYLASVSADAQRQYLSSERYRYITAVDKSELAGFIAIRDDSHLFTFSWLRHINTVGSLGIYGSSHQLPQDPQMRQAALP